MRTEWSQFSTIFIGQSDREPVAAGASLRSADDQRVLKGTFQVRMPETRALAMAGTHSMEGLATYLSSRVTRCS